MANDATLAVKPDPAGSVPQEQYAPDAIWREAGPDESGNVTHGTATAIDCAGCFHFTEFFPFPGKRRDIAQY